MSAPTLRGYQSAGLDAIAQALEAGTNRQLLQMATGTGKTVLFAELRKRLAPWLEQFPERQRRMLVIAHREELLDQAARKILAANPGIMVSVEQGDRYANSYSDVVIASIQTLAARKFHRLHRLLERHTFRIVVVDEAHHAAAPSYRTALVHLGFLPPADASDKAEVEAANFDDVAKMQAALAGWDAVAPKDRLLLGVTATPNRSDAIGLGCVFQSIVYTYPIKQAIDDSHLVPIVPWAIDTDTSLDNVKITAGEFNQKDLAEAVNNLRRNQLAVQGWMEHAMGLSTIAFTVDVQHAHNLADVFNKAGAVARPLSGETPKDERRQLLADYERGKIQVLTNCMVLTEGTDLPLTGCILHAKPTRSATLYEQMTGRGLRPYPGKAECVVIDVVDVARRHSLQTAPVLYGLPPGLNANGKPLQQLDEELQLWRQEHANIDLESLLASGRLTLEQLKIRSERIDPWAVLALGAFGDGRAFDWIRSGADEYRLSYPWQDGTEILLVERDMLGKFDLSLTLRPREGGPPRQRTLAAGVATAAEAAGIAEAFVERERREVTKLKAVDAPWKQRPASDKQKGLLRRLRVPFREPLTMGQAGKLIDTAMARRGGRR